MKEDIKDSPLVEVIRKVGSANELARQLGVTPQAISQWKRIPLERASEIARITGIPRAELRPDIWGEHAA